MATPPYSPYTRVERVIAVGRLVLASFSLLAVSLDPTDPAEFKRLAYALLSSYVAYSAAMVALVWRSEAPLRRRLRSHIIDLLVVFGFSWVTEGTNSPLFPFLVFALAAASLRWQWRGTAWTAAGILVPFVGMGVYDMLAAGPGFEFNEFLIRCAALAVISVVLGELGASVERMRQDMERLAVRSDDPGVSLEALLGRLLQWAAHTLRAPRVLIAWEETGEPSLHFAEWRGGECRYVKERPGALEALVAKEIAEASFLCQRADASRPCVLQRSSGGFARWHGSPLDPGLRARYAIRSVVSVRLPTEAVSGWLFVLDKERMTSDDLMMGEIVSLHLAASLSQFHLRVRLAAAAAMAARTSLARELHDGAFHALTGVALELEALLRLPKLQLAGAQGRLRAIQSSLVEEQRTLRSLIDSLRRPSSWPSPGANHEAYLANLARRMERQWGLRVEWSATGLDGLPSNRVNDLYLMVHEALINVARHAGASVARLDAAVRDGRAHIVVSDDGHGFDFKGRYDHEALSGLRLGPSTLRERAALLGGGLTLESTATGARLEISFPVGDEAY